jgi:hypothetical protein
MNYIFHHSSLVWSVLVYKTVCFPLAENIQYSKPLVICIFHDQLIAFIFAIKKAKKYEIRNKDTKIDLSNRILMTGEWIIPSIILRTGEFENDLFFYLD